MVSRKPQDKEQHQDSPVADFVVTAPFAYATALSGEVKQLRRGDLVFADKFHKDSIVHLVSIGFLADRSS